MQLSEAIDGWLAAHSAGLSGSTRRDIADIAASADRCGYGWMECIDVRERHIDEIVADADARSSLNASAIAQFLDIAVEWAVTQAETGGVRNDLLPSDTDGWLDPDAPPVVDDLDSVAWVDDLPPVDDLDVDGDGELDPVDDDQIFEIEPVDEPDGTDDAEAGVAAEAEPEPEPEPVPAPSPEPEVADEPEAEAAPEPNADADLVDEDDFDDDELAAIDDDLATTDEDDLDDDELDTIDGDLDALLDDEHRDEDQDSDRDSNTDDADDDLFVAIDDSDTDALDTNAPDGDEPQPSGASAFSAAAASGAPADPAASSFLRTLEQTGQTPAVFGDLAKQLNTGRVAAVPAAAEAEVPSIDTAQSGIFSEAAQYDGERSIDWITVAYFAVAAICFALVIYFYLSS